LSHRPCEGPRRSARRGQAQATEIVRISREQDTQTLQCDWFISEDRTELEVDGLFPNEQGLMEHQLHIMEARTVLFL